MTVGIAASAMAGLVATTQAGAVPAPRAATVAGSLTASATSVLAGSSVALQGKLPPRKARPVVLQQSVGGRWVPVADRTSSARGGFRFVVEVDEGTSRYRVSAPRTKIAGSWYPALVTPKVSLTGEPAGGSCATPPQSLAVVRPGTTDYSVRTYAEEPPVVVGQCDAAPDSFEPWWGYATTVGGSYFTAVDGAGRLVEMVADPKGLDVTVRDPLTYAVQSTRSADLGSWGAVGSVLRAANGDFFVLQGRANLDESPDAVVLRVRRYDANLVLQGTALVPSGIEPGLGVRRPFNAGTASMVESNGTLVVHLAREMTKADDGKYHQANLTLTLDTGSMEPTLVPDTYTSHSFNQLVTVDGADAVFLDHGDAYPRSLVLTVISDLFTGATGSARHEVWKLPGGIGDNYTGTTVNGLVTGSGRALITGVSVPHGNAVDGVTGSGDDEDRLLRNAYVISTDLGTGTSTHRWLTTYNPNRTDLAVTEPKIVKLAADRFAVLFGVSTSAGDTTEYRLVDPAGTVIGSESFPLAFQPLAEPMVSGSRLFWEGAHQWDDDNVRRGSHHLFGLDVSNPAAPQLLAP